MRSKLVIFVFTTLFICSCVEGFQLDTDNQHTKLLVESALLDIDSVHYVKLSLSKIFLSQNETVANGYGTTNYYPPVTDAKVIITDNHSFVDTLVGEPDSIYYPRDSYNAQSDKWKPDSIFDINEHSLSKGYYSSRKLKIESGNTYYLTVLWQGKKYTSSCFVPKVPTIDSVRFAYTQGATGKEDYYIPYIYFKDNPATKDYYLFITSDSYPDVWSRTVLSDEFINNNVNGIDVFKGETLRYWLNAYPYERSNYKIEMHAITKEIYDYYKCLSAQFMTDGGVYTAAPASPPSNISNGALGYFRASSVQVYKSYLQ